MGLSTDTKRWLFLETEIGLNKYTLVHNWMLALCNYFFSSDTGQIMLSLTSDIITLLPSLNWSVLLS